MKKLQKLYRLLAMMLAMTCFVSGCGSLGDLGYESSKLLTYEEATKELAVKLTTVNISNVDVPLYYGDNDYDTAVILGDIDDSFPITVQGNGKINIEIAAATELSATKVPDDLINVWADDFNKAGFQIDGKTVSATIRKITSGEVLTYMVNGEYRPDLYVPSFTGWGEMLEVSGFNTIKLTDRLVGNTAGILMKQETYESFIEKYDEVTMGNVIEAALAGDIVFAVTNPYTSSTGLNELSESLICFDPKNPLSDTAAQKLLEYQKIAPAVSYTTAALQDRAVSGKIDAMIMEEQAYIKTPDLKDYVYTPFGLRHDHPTYTFDYVSSEKQEAAKLFVEYCLSVESQEVATKKGFNLHDDYVPQSEGLSGAEYLAAQKLWKQNKNGGAPIIAVFVADVSGSMRNYGRLAALKESLSNSIKYIGDDAYVGLITFSDDVYINVDPFPETEESKKRNDDDNREYQILQFEGDQRDLFASAVNNLTSLGNTATYNGVLAGLDMLRKGKELVPNAKLIMFVLSDGERTTGYKLKQVTDIVAGMRVPVYTIAYSLKEESAREELEMLGEMNEAVMIDVEPEGIVNELRNLFNANL